MSRERRRLLKMVDRLTAAAATLDDPIPSEPLNAGSFPGGMGTPTWARWNAEKGEVEWSEWTSSTSVCRPDTVCPYCSDDFSWTTHVGVCPKVKAFEYHKDGTLKRVEFKDDADEKGQNR
jgi:hypothetical protein